MEIQCYDTIPSLSCCHSEENFKIIFFGNRTYNSRVYIQCVTFHTHIYYNLYSLQFFHNPPRVCNPPFCCSGHFGLTTILIKCYFTVKKVTLRFLSGKGCVGCLCKAVRAKLLCLRHKQGESAFSILFTIDVCKDRKIFIQLHPVYNAQQVRQREPNVGRFRSSIHTTPNFRF